MDEIVMGSSSKTNSDNVKGMITHVVWEEDLFDDEDDEEE